MPKGLNVAKTGKSNKQGYFDRWLLSRKSEVEKSRAERAAYMKAKEKAQIKAELQSQDPNYIYIAENNSSSYDWKEVSKNIYDQMYSQRLEIFNGIESEEPPPAKEKQVNVFKVAADLLTIIKTVKFKHPELAKMLDEGIKDLLSEVSEDLRSTKRREKDAISLKEQQYEAVKRLEGKIKTITTETATFIGTVISIGDNDEVLMNCRGGDVLVKRPEMTPPLQIGEAVQVHAETQQILCRLKIDIPGAEASLIEDLGKEAVVEVGGRKYRLPKSESLKIEAGAVAIVDKSNSVVIGSSPAPKEFIVSEVPDITWDDIGGLESEKEEMREAIEMSVLNAELYKKFGKKALKGILLSGPPGCGKTLLAKAAANQISQGTSLGIDGAFLYVKGPELLSMWVGDTENKIRELFRRAKGFKKKTNNPGVIFIDEAESLLSSRGGNNSSMMSRTVVPAFLAEWDGLEESGALIILATNRPNDLDEAIVREGRIDRKIHIMRPTAAHCVAIFGVHLLKTQLKDSLPSLVKAGVTEVFAPHSRLKEKVSGALIANLVDRAAGAAIKRAIKEKEKKPGIVTADMVFAVQQSNHEYAHLN